MRNDISLNDIKFDLLKIIEPFDGRLEENKPRPVRHLFVQYLRDLQKEKLIYDFGIDTSDKDTSFMFDINIRMQSNRSPKNLRIYAGKYQHPWCGESA